MSIFKACDIRGVYGVELTESITAAIGSAVADVLGRGPVLVAGDGRTSTPDLKTAFSQGLTAGGVDVLDAGMMPTPAFHFACRYASAAVGAMITASHNPARYNGIKLSVDGSPASARDLRAIESQAGNPTGARSTSRGTAKPIQGCLARYEADRLIEATGIAGMRIVVDGGNGVMGPVACRVLAAAGVVVEPLYCEVDGTFPNRSPNPADAGALEALCSRVIGAEADLGVAFDGDGDRALFVDHLGRTIPPDVAIVLLARQALADRPGGSIVYDQKCSAIVPEAIAVAGGTARMERSGYAFMRVTMDTFSAAYGGELSGHHFFGDIGFDDGLLATIRMARLVHTAEQSVANLVDAIGQYATTPDIRVHVPPGRAAEIIRSLETGLADAVEIVKLDGVMARFPAGWALARESVTEPVVTFRMEGHTLADLSAIIQQVRRFVPELPEGLV